MSCPECGSNNISSDVDIDWERPFVVVITDYNYYKKCGLKFNITMRNKNGFRSLRRTRKNRMKCDDARKLLADFSLSKDSPKLTEPFNHLLECKKCCIWLAMYLKKALEKAQK